MDNSFVLKDRKKLVFFLNYVFCIRNFEQNFAEMEQYFKGFCLICFILSKCQELVRKLFLKTGQYMHMVQNLKCGKADI